MPGNNGSGNPYITWLVIGGVLLAYGVIGLLFTILGHGYYPPSD